MRWSASYRAGVGAADDDTMSEREVAEVLGEPLSGMEAIIDQGLLHPIRVRPGQRRFATVEVYRAFLTLHGHQRQAD